MDRDEQRPAHGPERPPGLGRRIAFAAIISTLVLALLLGGLEGALRLAGYGASPHFLRRVTLADGTMAWRENRECTAPFFSRALVRRPQPMRLSIPKPPRTFRIVILGSSAAMGDPDASFSIARVLEKMLAAAYPDIRCEVVNAGITAINSHLVRGIAEDCARLQPDLFIVYEGHNEVIGPFGPSGVLTPFLRTGGAVRAAVALKGTRTGQLIAAAAGALRPDAGGVPAQWGGMEMFLAQRIAADDPRLEAVRAHFRANLLAIAAAAQKAGASTLVCTAASNQRTFAPFASMHRPGLPASDLRRWQEHFADAEAATRAGDRPGAEAAYRAALAIDDRHAELHYRLGQLALLAGRHAEARASLQRALDLDALRFRTDSALNEVIRSLTGTPGLQVIDAEAELAAASPHGICGDEFFYEHVHFTLRGVCELARALLPAVRAELERRLRVAAATAPPVELSCDELRVLLGFTAYEQGMIAAEMLERFSRAPFTAQSDHAARIDLWQRRAAAAREVLSRPGAREGLKAAMDAAMDASPGDWVLSRNAGMMLLARGDAAGAVPLLERARSWIDDDADTLAALATACRNLGDTGRADALLASLRRIEPRHPAVRPAP